MRKYNILTMAATTLATLALALGATTAGAQSSSFFRIGKPPQKTKKTPPKAKAPAATPAAVKKAAPEKRVVKRRRRRVYHERVFGIRLGWSRKYVERRFRRRRVRLLGRNRLSTMYAGSIFRSPGLSAVYMLFQKGRLAKVMLVYGAEGSGPQAASTLAAKYRYLRKYVSRRFGNPTQQAGFVDERVPDFSLALASGMATYFTYWHNPKGVRILLSLDRNNGRPAVTLSYQSMEHFLTPPPLPWVSVLPEP
ncbi:MAG: hypothetical protein KJ621_10965 [Proteobacteria bacterium]|nr:hypothetical protein [Pseudomonadota bacterium]MBU1741845.1 hypothetical protein [Pseudomonadota bacterium]